MTGNPTDLEDLYELMREDSVWDDLRKGKNRLVPGEGARDKPKAFIIGEAPGAEEAMALRPFVGKSGKVLRQLMASANLYTFDWENVEEKRYGVANAWLTNVVKYRPPSNRTPTPYEIKLARPYLRKEWELVGSPQLIIPVGAVALYAVMGRPKSITGNAGNPFRSESGKIVWPMLHPAYGLRNEEARADMEKHWKVLGKRLKAGLYDARY